ncbi:MAG TPA: TonB family protein [Mucilaginibacter sp.]|jgi:TonB family protein
MFKPILITILGFFSLNIATAQKTDTVVYYLKSDGKVVDVKDSADFFLVILPPDTNVDKTLFRVNEFYKNGKTRLMGSSTTNNLNLKFQGSQITFFSNGHKMRIRKYENGELIGDVIEYYPNGKLYNTTSVAVNGGITFNECHDTTGNAITINGNGKWIRFFGESFDKYYMEGQVENGLQQGKWTGKMNDTVNVVWTFENGQLVSAKDFDLEGRDITNLFMEGEPEFPGGPESMNRFIERNKRYPNIARKNGTHGTVVIGFVVEADGTLTNFKVVKGIGDGCDEEALRILKIVSKWRYGIRRGKPAKIDFEVSISFP